MDYAINNPNPRRQVTREELQALFCCHRVMNEYDLTSELNDTGVQALRKFLIRYVKKESGIDAWPRWVHKAELKAHRHILMHYDGVMYASANETLSGEEKGMYVKWFYFDWYVRRIAS